MNLNRHPRPYRVALMPLALAAIIATTAIPLEFRPAIGWNGRFGYADIAENLLLYAPFGVALWRRGPTLAFLAGLLLSGVIESLQMWQIGRFASPVDVAANAVGAMVGALIWQRLAPGAAFRADQPMIGTRLLLALLVVASAFVANWMFPMRSAALTEWSPGFPLSLGGEPPGERLWWGELVELVIVSGTLSRTEIDSLRSQDVVPSGRTAYVLPGRVRFDDGRIRELPTAFAGALSASVRDSNSFTVIARINDIDKATGSAAAIVNFAADYIHRNFDLGLEGDRLTFRVRTAVSGEHANWILAKSDSPLPRGRDALVIATYDGGSARIRVDGALVARASFVAETCAVASLCDSALPAAWVLVGAALAAIALAYGGWRRSWHRIALALLAGACGAGCVLLLPAGSAVTFQAWTAWLALPGSAIVGLAARLEDSEQ